MPYPQDPFALKIRTSFECPTCKKRSILRETKDENSPFMEQARCTTQGCTFVSTVTALRTSMIDAQKKA